MIPRWLATSLVTLTSLVWAANFLVSLALPTYTTDPSLNGIFLLLVGGGLAFAGPQPSRAPKTQASPIQPSPVITVKSKTGRVILRGGFGFTKEGVTRHES